MTSQSSAGADYGVLEGIRVLDLTGYLGQMTARVLGDLGADVVKIEPPGGDPARKLGPFAGGNSDPEKSLRFVHANRSKRSAVIDILTDTGREQIRRLASEADVLVEDFAPGYLDGVGLGFESLSVTNAGLVFASVTPFGQTGSHAGWRGGEMIAEAAGGMMFANGDDAAPPVMAPFELTAQVAAVHTAFGVLMALRARRLVGGQGQRVDVSRQEIVLWLQNAYISRYAYQGDITRREGAHTAFGAVNTYATRDEGYVNVSVYSSEHFSRLGKNVMEHPILSEDVWLDRTVRRENRELIDELVGEFAATLTREEFVNRGQKGGIPIVPLLTLDEFVEHPQIKARGYMNNADHPVIGPHRIAGPPVRFGGSSTWKARSHAPLVGEHTEEVLQGWGPRTRAPREQSATNGHQASGTAVTPLQGIRVVDFTRAHAGYISTMFLGFFGAEIVKIESDGLEDPRTPGQTNFEDMNRNKMSCTIDVRTPDGREALLELVRQSDVVVEHFRPGVMDNLRLDYETLKSVKNDIIMLSMPGMGSEGPIREYRSYGQQVMGMTGLTHLWGHADGALNTRIKMPFPDYVAALLGATSVVAALEHREQTGEGQLVEMAQLEGQAHFLGTAILDYVINGTKPEPRGNFSETYAPHDVYRCLGLDAWAAIAVENDEQWTSLIGVLGNPSWTTEDRFSTLPGRVANKSDLDERLSEWTSGMTPHQVERALQKAGVPASTVATAEDLYYDPHLRDRIEGIVAIDHPEAGMIEHQGINVNLSRTPGTAAHHAPTKGEQNAYVFQELLALGEDRVKELVESGALR